MVWAIAIRAAVGIAIRQGARMAERWAVREGLAVAVRTKKFSIGTTLGLPTISAVQNAMLAARVVTADDAIEVLKRYLFNRVADEATAYGSDRIIRFQLAWEDRIKAANAAASRRRHEARRRAVVHLANAFASRIEAIAPDASGRYVRGWQQAFTKAGLEGHAPRRLHVPKYHRRLQDHMRVSAEYFQERGEKRWGSRTNKGALADLRRAIELRHRAQLLDDPEAVVDGADTVGPVIRVEHEPEGWGQMIDSEARTHFEFVNRVRHAQEVEARHHILQRATEWASRRADEAHGEYVDEISAAMATVGARPQ